jgi:superoxide dismutase, Fe-Mn family
MKTLLSLAIAALIGCASAASTTTAPPAAAPAAAFSLPNLPYANDALEPYIDAVTMDIHRTRHHKAQVDNLNAQVKTFPELANLSLEQILANTTKYNAAVRNNAGGHWNHSFFWGNMAPAGRGGAPSPELLAKITATFGSLDELKKQFNTAAAGRFGSGWAWLIVTDKKELAINSTANQDNPLMDIADVRGTPIVGLDVWEHAYYLKYQNKRGDYTSAWWNVVNWNDVNTRFAAATR